MYILQNKQSRWVSEWMKASYFKGILKRKKKLLELICFSWLQNEEKSCILRQLRLLRGKEHDLKHCSATSSTQFASLSSVLTHIHCFTSLEDLFISGHGKNDRKGTRISIFICIIHTALFLHLINLFYLPIFTSKLWLVCMNQSLLNKYFQCRDELLSVVPSIRPRGSGRKLKHRSLSDHVEIHCTGEWT